MNTLASPSASLLDTVHAVHPVAYLQNRSIRVTGLIVATALLNAMDLGLTLSHMRGAGFFEQNPIVVWLAQATDSWCAIAAYKLITVSICAGVLYRLRRHRAAELGAWICLLVLVALSIQWMRYNALINDVGVSVFLSTGVNDAGCITLD